MKKKLVTLFAILGALTAAAALVFVFRDKLKALFDRLKDRLCCCCSCDCEEDEPCDDFEEAPDEEEAPIEEEPVEEPAVEAEDESAASDKETT